ncbi:IucA/IucC family protein [Metabacillus arenae]|uniref:IucA/IucC family siderophore biosynthesis protein n=1 Tax=Metabacillus arenae TaxID=2771434 RepID=A0A926NFY8_9BACI|nr:IucA/IucC family protein [Metabacillus arenae]MBD1380561.1 IucA/IucC family siderophore biosynthesis protein [Metabacillus arenae]
MKKLAEQATIQSFLNCYLRETENYREEDSAIYFSKDENVTKAIIIPLKSQHIQLITGISYWSETGRHLFAFPLYYQVIGKEDLIPLDYVTLTAAITKELLLEQNRLDSEDELMLRVILSCKNIEHYLQKRGDEEKDFTTFIEAEQSLLLGHLLHPTPKSKQGITTEEEEIYSPELKGSFQLDYFKAHKTIVAQDSSLKQSAANLLKEELKKDMSISQSFLKEHAENPDYILIPAHPLQSKILLEKPEVKELMAAEKLIYLGAHGQAFSATSSMRTVYSKHSSFMFKFSVPVKITNSLRVNLQKELDRGVEVGRLLQTKLGDLLNENNPGFSVIQDPAYLNIEGVPGFEVVFRENPFSKNEDVTLIAGLCQDDPFKGKTKLERVIRQLAEKEERTTEQVSKDWFTRYLSLSLEPLYWLYENYGLALEAHQQNSVVKLENGYPIHFYYRDNQGYYYAESKANELKSLLPELSMKSETICTQDVAEERFRYYFFFNHLFGLINGFGAARLIEESKLLNLLSEKLEELANKSTYAASLLRSLLDEKKLPCKANLLTRFHDMDELVGSLETQSVYTMIKNPLYQREASLYEV